MQGSVFFDKEDYSRATECFKKATMPDKEAVAWAYHLREEARTTASGSKERSNAFIKASNAFRGCASSIPTAKREYLRTAAECYQNAGKHDLAAQLYEEIVAFDQAAQAYCDCTRFGSAVQIVRTHKQSMSPDVVNSVIRKARLFYFKENRQAYVQVSLSCFCLTIFLQRSFRTLLILRRRTTVCENGTS
jgi:tetratricopeptide (TPR) repeat protein